MHFVLRYIIRNLALFPPILKPDILDKTTHHSQRCLLYFRIHLTDLLLAIINITFITIHIGSTSRMFGTGLFIRWDGGDDQHKSKIKNKNSQNLFPTEIYQRVLFHKRGILEKDVLVVLEVSLMLLLNLWSCADLRLTVP